MRAPARSLTLLCLLAAAPLAAFAADRLAVYVAYDPAAPLDPQRSYACEALAPDDSGYDAHRNGRLPLDCRRIPLADLCGTVGSGDAKVLAPGCALLPVEGGAPTDAQVRRFADGLEAYFKGNLPKLNFTLLEMSRQPGAGFRANLRAGAEGASPAVGAWDAAAPTARVALATPLLTVDPAQPDTRYGNGWRNPHGSEWGAYLSKRTLDEVESDVRRALATPENPVPGAAAVTARASEEVALCRGSSVGALRADLRSHVARMSGVKAPRPALALPGNCKVEAAPALIPPPPPPPREYTATKPCGSGTRTFTSNVSQADANRQAREFRCPTWTASACGVTFTSSISQADANRQAANRRPCTYSASKTCGSRTRHFTSSVSQADANRQARAWSCPAPPRPKWTARACGQTVTSYVSQADADRRARELDCGGTPTGTTETTSRVSTPEPRTYTATKPCGSGPRTFESSVSQADANRQAREFRCPTWTASACGETFTSDISQGAADSKATNRRPCTYTAYKSCPSGRRKFTSTVSQAAAQAQADRWSCRTWRVTKSCPDGSSRSFTSRIGPADAQAQADAWSCPVYSATDCKGVEHEAATRAAARALAAKVTCRWTVTKSCPSGVTKTFTSNVSQADAQAQANRWSCPRVYTARACGETFTSNVSQADVNRQAASRRPCGAVTKSCPNGVTKTFTSSVSQAAAQAKADRWSCPAPPRVYTARDCKGVTYRAATQAAANALAANVKCPAAQPAVQRDVHEESEGVRDGECDSTDPSCGGTRDPDTFDETSKTHRVAPPRGGAGTVTSRPAPRTTYNAYRTCGSTRKSFSSTVSQSAANRLANAYRCPSRTRTYYAYRTCGSSRKTFSSTVSQSSANRLASAYRCPATRTTASTPRASYKFCNGRFQFVVSCPPEPPRRRVMLCGGRYVYATSCSGG